jgi:hypothetical protein
LIGIYVVMQFDDSHQKLPPFPKALLYRYNAYTMTPTTNATPKPIAHHFIASPSIDDFAFLNQEMRSTATNYSDTRVQGHSLERLCDISPTGIYAYLVTIAFQVPATFRTPKVKRIAIQLRL